jgi:hypothetical protein
MSARLEAERQALWRLSEARSLVAQKVLREQWTLPQALAELRLSMEVIHPHIHSFPFISGTQSEVEDVGWQVILSVEQELENHPDQKWVIARLEAELHDYLRTLGLPVSRIRFPVDLPANMAWATK